MEESIQILMNENNKSFHPSYMFEFIHHLEYGCCDLQGLIYKMPLEPNIQNTKSLATYILCIHHKDYDLINPKFQPNFKKSSLHT
jgi:hypothetical protein